MTLQERLSLLITGIGSDIKSITSKIGNMPSLTTTDKTSIVGAINEVKASIGSAGAQINDTTPSPSTAYSGAKVDASIAALKTQLIGGASSAMDTFKEIQDQMSSDETASAALVTSIGQRPTYAEIGTIDTDLVAVYNTAKS